MSERKKDAVGELAAQDDYRALELSVESPNWANAKRPLIEGQLSVPLNRDSDITASGRYMQQPYERPEWKAMLGYRRRF